MLKHSNGGRFLASSFQSVGIIGRTNQRRVLLYRRVRFIRSSIWLFLLREKAKVGTQLRHPLSAPQTKYRLMKLALLSTLLLPAAAFTPLAPARTTAFGPQKHRQLTTKLGARREAARASEVGALGLAAAVFLSPLSATLPSPVYAADSSAPVATVSKAEEVLTLNPRLVARDLPLCSPNNKIPPPSQIDKKISLILKEKDAAVLSRDDAKAKATVTPEYKAYVAAQGRASDALKSEKEVPGLQKKKADVIKSEKERAKKAAAKAKKVAKAESEKVRAAEPVKHPLPSYLTYLPNL